jgi:hypothetical protein
LLYDAAESNLQYGSSYPDAPKRFFDDRDFSRLWAGPSRVFLVVPDEHMEEVRDHLPANSVWEFANTGGKAVYMNQPMNAGQPAVGSPEAKLEVNPLRK